MNKLDLLKIRRAELLNESADLRKKIAQIIDDESFVEFDSYSFSENAYYEGNVGGEGVVTGCATLNDNAIFIVAQNVAKLAGGVTDANCQKICKCLSKAVAAGAPVLYLLDTKGVAVGEGVNVLEGIADVLAMSNELKSERIPQISVVLGEVYGSFALLVANCDYNFMLKDSCVAYASPVVIAAASGKIVDKAEIGGIASAKYNSLITFSADSLDSVRDTIAKLYDTLPLFNGDVETMDDYNRCTPSLNEKVCADCVIKAVFDENYFIELNKGFASDVITGIGRIGGMAAAAIVFGGDDKGVELTCDIIDKIKEFVYYCDDNGLPLITFVNTLGIKADLATSNSLILKKISNLTYALCALSTSRINVVYGNAIGLGYTLFLSKSFGAEYSYAFATSKISLFETAKGAMIELAGISEGNKDKAEAEYADEVQDPFNAARNGYIDEIIEPQYVRAYLINALQTIVR